MKTKTASGAIQSGVVYEIEYSCDTPGPGVEKGAVTGYWNGEIDTWGKLTIIPMNLGAHHYLFPDEFTSLERVA